MAERRHEVGQNLRFVAATERTWLYFYQSWGASMRREVRMAGAQWWNPISWLSGYRWEARGDVAPFDVQFLTVGGLDITNRVAPSVSTGPGLRRVAIVFAQIGLEGGSNPGGAPLADLGNDARAVDNVVMHYIIDGEARTLSHR